MFTDSVQYDTTSDPVCLQRCRCLEQAGFPFTQAEFHVEVAPAHLQAAGITLADAGTYFHLSPFTTADQRELPPEQLIELITGLEERFPEQRWVLSGAPTERERKKMEALVARLPSKPWRVFAGELSLVQLAAVIKHCSVHLSGNTGTVHLALMTGTRSVSWFRPDSGMRAWVPVGERHRVIVGPLDTKEGFLQGVQTAELLRAVVEVLETPGSAPG
jgi:ADP-heptose:LPS heptosyltransferase